MSTDLIAFSPTPASTAVMPKVGVIIKADYASDPTDPPLRACYVFMRRVDGVQGYAATTICGTPIRQKVNDLRALRSDGGEIIGTDSCETCVAGIVAAERRRRGVGQWVAVDEDVNNYWADVTDEPGVIARAMDRVMCHTDLPSEFTWEPVRYYAARTDRVWTQQLILGYTRSVRTVRYEKGQLRVLSATTCPDQSLAAERIVITLLDKNVIVCPLIG